MEGDQEIMKELKVEQLKYDQLKNDKRHRKQSTSWRPKKSKMLILNRIGYEI